MNRVITVASIAFAAILGYQGFTAFGTLRNKATAQEDSTEALQRWQQSYLALSDSQKQWSSQYPSSGAVEDLYSLLQLVSLQRYSLRTDPDTVSLTRVEPVQGNGLNLGLVRYCLSSQGAADNGALRVEASSYTELLAGLRKLASVPYVYIGTIGIQGDKPQPAAILGDFCLQLRQQEPAK